MFQNKKLIINRLFQRRMLEGKVEAGQRVDDFCAVETKSSQDGQQMNALTDVKQKIIPMSGSKGFFQSIKEQNQVESAVINSKMRLKLGDSYNKSNKSNKQTIIVSQIIQKKNKENSILEKHLKNLRATSKKFHSKYCKNIQLPASQWRMSDELFHFMRNICQRYDFQEETHALAHYIFRMYQLKTSSNLNSSSISYLEQVNQNQQHKKYKQKLIIAICIWISAKYIQVQVPKVNDYQYYLNFNHIFTDKYFLEMERKILTVIDYDLKIVTIANLLNFYMNFKAFLSQHDQIDLSTPQISVNQLKEEINKILQDGQFMIEQGQQLLIKTIEHSLQKSIKKVSFEIDRHRKCSLNVNEYECVKLSFQETDTNSSSAIKSLDFQAQNPDFTVEKLLIRNSSNQSIHQTTKRYQRSINIMKSQSKSITNKPQSKRLMRKSNRDVSQERSIGASLSRKSLLSKHLSRQKSHHIQGKLIKNTLNDQQSMDIKYTSNFADYIREECDATQDSITLTENQRKTSRDRFQRKFEGSSSQSLQQPQNSYGHGMAHGYSNFKVIPANSMTHFKDLRNKFIKTDSLQKGSLNILNKIL